MVITWIELEEFSTIEGVGIYMWFVCGVQLLCVCHYREIGMQEWSIALECYWSIYFTGYWVSAGLSLHFLRKRRFLSVILLDPSTLIRYCRPGRAVMIFPVVFHL